MVRQNYKLTDRGALYDTGAPDYAHYEQALETGSVPSQIFVDKSQHVTNYVFNINVTGDVGQSPEPGLGVTEPIYMLEADVTKTLVAALGEIEEALDDPASFEQRLAEVLALLEKLDERKPKREVYFTDLLSMLRMALVNIECGELTTTGLAVLKEGANALAVQVTAERLQALRSRFRSSGIDILKPFQAVLDMKEVMGEMYPNETAT